jgi:hypothetical protein
VEKGYVMNRPLRSGQHMTMRKAPIVGARAGGNNRAAAGAVRTKKVNGMEFCVILFLLYLI